MCLLIIVLADDLARLKSATEAVTPETKCLPSTDVCEAFSMWCGYTNRANVANLIKTEFLSTKS